MAAWQSSLRPETQVPTTPSLWTFSPRLLSSARLPPLQQVPFTATTTDYSSPTGCLHRDQLRAEADSLEVLNCTAVTAWRHDMRCQEMKWPVWHGRLAVRAWSRERSLIWHESSAAWQCTGWAVQLLSRQAGSVCRAITT